MTFSRKTTLAIAIVLGCVSAAFAGPIEDRKAKMKAVGKNTGILGKMVKGATPFDGEMALAAYVAMGEAATGFGDLFPENSKTGGETTASAKIWEDPEGFKAKGQVFGEALAAAIQAGAPENLDALKATFGNVAKNCKACHQDYRIKN